MLYGLKKMPLGLGTLLIKTQLTPFFLIKTVALRNSLLLFPYRQKTPGNPISSRMTAWRPGMEKTVPANTGPFNEVFSKANLFLGPTRGKNPFLQKTTLDKIPDTNEVPSHEKEEPVVNS